MNFHKNDARSVSLVLLAFSMIAAPAFSSNAFAQNFGISINVDASEGSSEFSVSGQTTTLLQDITIQATAPQGNLVFVDQISPSLNGQYAADVKIGDLWKQDGWYTIKAQQGSSTLYQVSVQVEVTDGIARATSASESSLDFDEDPIRLLDNLGGLTFTADAPQGALTIGIDGKTDHANAAVTLIVKAPNDNVISVDQVDPDQDGIFRTVINVGCPTWKQDGFYTITAQQGENNRYTDSAEVEIKDCVVVPEFGTVAVLVLAVAIISIIAVTTRSRLGIMPRY